jgi:hypothetical protein
MIQVQTGTEKEHRGYGGIQPNFHGDQAKGFGKGFGIHENPYLVSDDGYQYPLNKNDPPGPKPIDRIQII